MRFPKIAEDQLSAFLSVFETLTRMFELSVGTAAMFGLYRTFLLSGGGQSAGYPEDQILLAKVREKIAASDSFYRSLGLPRGDPLYPNLEETQLVFDQERRRIFMTTLVVEVRAFRHSRAVDNKDLGSAEICIASILEGGSYRPKQKGVDWRKLVAEFAPFVLIREPDQGADDPFGY